MGARCTGYANNSCLSLNFLMLSRNLKYSWAVQDSTRTSNRTQSGRSQILELLINCIQKCRIYKVPLLPSSLNQTFPCDLTIWSQNISAISSLWYITTHKKWKRKVNKVIIYFRPSVVRVFVCQWCYSTFIFSVLSYSVSIRTTVPEQEYLGLGVST